MRFAPVILILLGACSGSSEEKAAPTAQSSKPLSQTDSQKLHNQKMSQAVRIATTTGEEIDPNKVWGGAGNASGNRAIAARARYEARKIQMKRRSEAQDAHPVKQVKGIDK